MDSSKTTDPNTADARAVVNVRDCGAVGDGKTKDTGPIQRAMDLATTMRGGAVVKVPRGRYLVGTLFLRDRVTLDLDERASLVASADPGDLFTAPVYQDRIATNGRRVLIYAKSVRDAGLSGTGAIDGQDALFWDQDKIFRPRLALLEGCSNVTVEGVAFVRPSIYSLWVIDCEDVAVRGIKVVSGFEPRNTDGVHLESCRRVVIEDSSFVTGDDSIAIDGNGTGASEDVVVRRCAFDSSNNAVRIFTGLSPWSVATCGATDNAVRNVAVEDLDVRDAAGCVNIIAHSGVVEDIQVRGVRARMRRTGVPVFIMNDRGRVSNVSIEGIDAASDGSVVVVGSGDPDDVIEGVSVTDSRFTVRPHGKRHGTDLPDGPQRYPVYHQAPYGIYLRDAADVRIERVSVAWSGPPDEGEQVSAIRAQRLQQLSVREFDGVGATADAPSVDLDDVVAADLRDCAAGESAAPYLSVGGELANSVVLADCDLSRAAAPWRLAPGVSDGVVRDASAGPDTARAMNVE